MTHQTKRSFIMLALPLLLAMTSLGCGLNDILGEESADPELPSTRTPMPTFTPTADGAAFVQISATNTPLPTPIPVEPPPAPAEPTATPPPAQDPVSPVASPTPETSQEAAPAPAPSGPAQVTILQDMNVRTGPGTNYPIAGPGPAGESAAILGRNADNSWVQVEYPLTADKTGWVYAELVDISGDLNSVAVVQAPPPPAAPPPAAEQPAQEAAPPPPPAPSYMFTPTGWFASENAGIVQFKGRIYDEGGNLVNGFSVLADNGSFRVLSHPTGASHWYPDKGDGEWDVVMPNIGQAQGWWWLTVVRYECDFAGGFDALCPQYTRLSEDVKIEIRTPEESIINADWTCHWDCNTGLYQQGFRR